MKIKCIAIAVVLFCAKGAQADGSLNIYGVVDTNVEFANNVGVVPTAANGFNAGTGNKVSRLNSGGLSGSRWGIRGVEEISGDLRALFVLENGFNADTGTIQQNGRLFGRQAFTGIESKRYGLISFGRQYTSLFDSTANFVPAYFAAQYEPIIALAGANFREDNMIKYTGKFGPVTAIAHWSFGTGLALPQVAPNVPAIGGNGEVPGQFRRDSAYGASVSYSDGTFSAALGYDQFNPTIGSGIGQYKKALAAVSYGFNLVRIMGGYRWGRNLNQASVEIGRDDYYWVGAIYQVTPAFSAMLEYTYDNLKNVYGNYRAPNPWQINLIGAYQLSKRTDVYISTAYAKNAGLMLETSMNSFVNSLAFGNSYSLGNGKNSMTGVAVGIRHKF